MGALSFSTAQIDSALEKVINRNYAICSNPADTADTVTFSAGEIGVFKLVPLSLSVISENLFTPVTNGLRFDGDNGTLFVFNGTSTIGTNQNNTTVQFRLAINGVTKSETTSTIKLDTTTALSTINASSGVILNKNDVVQVYCKVDKACTISAYNTQLQLLEV